jgi:hypothetical protein
MPAAVPLRAFVLSSAASSQRRAVVLIYATIVTVLNATT